MNTRETILLGVLKHKQSRITDEPIVTQWLEDAADADGATRNFCARVPVSLLDRIDAYSDVLGMNKREIMNAALVAFLDEVDDVMNEYGVHPFSNQSNT